MPSPTPQDVRQILLEEVARARPRTPMDGTLQQSIVLRQVRDRLQIVNNLQAEQLVLSEWYNLFNTGYLAWGHDLSNSNPPFCHVTAKGSGALGALSRDPSNPSGYLAYLASLASLNPIASSYLSEGLECYVAGHYKAAAVMLGCASECLILSLRDTVAARLAELGQKPTPRLMDWRIKTVLDELQALLESQVSHMPRELRDEFSAYWPAFTQQLRAVRNDAGHPSSVDPVSPEAAHAAYLVFPLVAQLANRLNSWATAELH